MEIQKNTPATARRYPPLIVLYGPPGSGKSSLGQMLSRRLGLPFYDLDEHISAQAGQSIIEIFSVVGEAGFRRLESQALQEVIKESAGVIALGGGTLLDPANRRLVESAAQVLCLQATFEALSGRLQGNQRPLLQGDQQTLLQALLAQRRDHYASFPCRLDVSSLSLEQAAWQAQVALGFYQVAGMGAAGSAGSYPVWTQSGALAQLGSIMRSLNLKGPVALVSDENTAGLYNDLVSGALRCAGYEVQMAVLPPGEAYKTIASATSLWESFLKAGLERNSTVIALGGGVVGDLAGFAASTYLRGVRWLIVPTTLLAMVDASLGGKTGVDLPAGKNLAGAFHAPSLVVADPETLASLPDIELRNGMAEVVKHAVIGDPHLFDLCSQGWEVLQADWQTVVRRAQAVKLRIIQIDPFEKGERASLNLGHTLGHALEQVSGYRIKHGEGVAIGMLAAARLAEREGIAESGLAGRIETLLTCLGLPVQIPPELSRQDLLLAMKLDKKRSAGKVRFVLPVRIGEVRWGVEIDDLNAIFSS
jgi:3-dehydroquinate synthase